MYITIQSRLSGAGFSKHFQGKRVKYLQMFDRFDKKGVEGLKNQKGKGRKPILTTSNARHVEVVENSIEKEK